MNSDDTTPAGHTPFVPASTVLPDLNIKTLVVGSIFGMVFGSANAYLGLRVGLTVSTSIPLAVISVVVFGALARMKIFRSSTILENNIAQSTGSAASSVASGVIFTLPALFMWGFDPPLVQMMVLAMSGAVLGTLLMIPLRRFLIVKEHGNLPYPEGTASARVLVAADQGGAQARPVFIGMAAGFIYKLLAGFLKLWPDRFHFPVPALPKAEIGSEASPALLGVGYILGYRISAIMVAGGLLSAIVLTPLIAYFGEPLATAIGSHTSIPISQMDAHQIWKYYVKYIGAGAVAGAGIITVARGLPMMYESLSAGLKGLSREGRRAAAAVSTGRRTDRDLPAPVILTGLVLVALAVIVLPYIAGPGSSFGMRLCAAAAVVVFGFLFVTVSSRIVGLIGVSSNPTSGMTIVTLLGTSTAFYLAGWTDMTGRVAALTIGTVVCVAASIAGDISQDLKTGYIIGATPWKQQVGEVVGACLSATVICYVVRLLGEQFTFGSIDLPAPQAALMKTIIDGVLSGDLPWTLVLIGVSLAVVASVMRLPPLPFAVGIYLPLAAMVPVFLGGVLRYAVEERYQGDEEEKTARKEKGVLFGSGLIAGEGLMGIGAAAIAFAMGRTFEGIGPKWSAVTGGIVSFVTLCVIGWLIVRSAVGKNRILK